MSERARKTFDVLVVGAGPAGLAAATAAAECGARVGIVDDNPTVGGQIWRGETAHPQSEVSRWAAKLSHTQVQVLCRTCVLHADVLSRTLFAENQDGLLKLGYAKLILATGARERFLPFPGWTLPNVMAAGGLQAMVKSGMPIAGKRVLIAGTGPLLLAVAAYLRSKGAVVKAICEQASWTSLTRFELAALRQSGKSIQALALIRNLTGVPFRANTWPVRALGDQLLHSVVVSSGGKTRELACDYLACGFHLVPNTELATLCGCNFQAGLVEVDDSQQTSVPDIFCAGEPTGIVGLEASLVEGRIAGLCAAGSAPETSELRRRQKMQSFKQTLKTAFELRHELRSLPENDTIVCRCEDVKHGTLRRHGSWRSAKLQTRCGMGPCQGRVCGPTAEFLYGWKPDSVRPPIFPAPLEVVGEFTGG